MDLDGPIDAACVVLRAGSTIRIRPGEATVIRARELVIEGELVVNGRGDPATRPPEWRSSGPCLNAHYDWLVQTRRADVENLGRAGGAGGTLEIRYGRVVGGNARLALIRFDVEGGEGTPGRALGCGCDGASHDDHTANFPAGPRGSSGTWRFIEEGE